MRAQSAAPEGLLAGTSGGRINSGNATSLPRERGEVILERFHAHGASNLSQVAAREADR